MSPKEKLFLWIIVLICLGIIVIGYSWNANSFFTGAYSPVVEHSIEQKKVYEEYQKKEGIRSDQPAPLGLKEREIEKQQGDRFSTY